MTDGLSRVAGVGPSITLGGKSYQVRGKTLEYYAALEAEIIKTRGSNPFDLLVNSAEKLKSDPALLQMVLRELGRQAKAWRFVDYLDIYDFLATPRGMALHIWLCIKNAPGAPSQDECYVQFMQEVNSRGGRAHEWQSEVESAIKQASGEDQLGNSTGRDEVAVPAA